MDDKHGVFEGFMKRNRSTNNNLIDGRAGMSVPVGPRGQDRRISGQEGEMGQRAVKGEEGKDQGRGRGGE